MPGINERATRLFIEPRIASMPPVETPPASPVLPLPEELAIGTHLIWEYFRPQVENQGQRSGPAGHFVLLGLSGSGKTALLHHIVRCCSGSGKGNRSLWEAPLSHIPALVLLHDQVDYICPKNERTGERVLNPNFSLVDALCQTVPAKHTTPIREWLVRQLNRGQCLVMLDGLDGVGNSEVRHLVAVWIQKQKTLFGCNPFLITARTREYWSNPLRDVGLLELLPFTREQQQQWGHDWYLLEEKGRLRDHRSVCALWMQAGEGVGDLLEQIQQSRLLSEQAGNPLLLTWRAILHRSHGRVVPQRRAELYARMCEALIEAPAAPARTVMNGVTTVQKQGVLQSLAYTMMRENLRKITREAAAAVIQDALQRLLPGIPPQAFLEWAVDQSGVLIRRGSGELEFAHHTLQEFLAAVQIQERQLQRELAGDALDSWWRETIRFYCARADATPILRACLADGSPAALALAFEFLDDAWEVDPAVRQTFEDILRTGAEDIADEKTWRVTVDALLQRRIRRLASRDSTQYSDDRLITNAEYQLFVDETATAGKGDVRPLHWQSQRFLPGEGRKPVCGMLPEHAQAFCEWLSERFRGTGFRYRLPYEHEVNPHSIDDSPGLGYWVRRDGRNGLASDAPASFSAESAIRREPATEAICQIHFFTAVLLRILDTAGEVPRDRSSALAHDLAHAIASARGFDNALNRYDMGTGEPALVSDLALAGRLNAYVIANLDLRLPSGLHLTGDLARARGLASPSGFTESLGEDLSGDLASASEVARRISHASALVSALASAAANARKLPHALGSIPIDDLVRIRDLAHDLALATALASVRAFASSSASVLASTLASDLAVAGKETSPDQSQAAFQSAIFCLLSLIMIYSSMPESYLLSSITMLRISGRLSAWEGIRIVRESVTSAS